MGMITNAKTANLVWTLETKFLMLRNFSGRDSADRGTATPYFDRDSPISQLILYINHPPPTAAPTVLQINLNITAGTVFSQREVTQLQTKHASNPPAREIMNGCGGRKLVVAGMS